MRHVELGIRKIDSIVRIRKTKILGFTKLNPRSRGRKIRF